MIVCNCNGISEREVTVAVSNGATQWDDVHAYYEREPCCGKCECEISDAIAEFHAPKKSEKRRLFSGETVAAAT